MSTSTIVKGIIRTYSGCMIDVMCPNPELINIEDGAHALSQLCRYGGHTNKFYSVAQHSIACSYMVSHENALGALVHDFSEAYACDLPSPIKKNIPIYYVIEENIQQVIAEKYNIPYPFSQEIHDVDAEILKYEWDYFMLGKPNVKHKEFYKRFFKPKSIKSVKEEFLARFKELYL